MENEVQAHRAGVPLDAVPPAGSLAAADGQGKNGKEHTLTVIVFSPRTPEPKTFHWDKTLKVRDAAREAASAFGYVGGNPGLQTETQPPRVLDNDKPLVAEHVRDGDKLEIIDTGGGV